MKVKLSDTPYWAKYYDEEKARAGFESDVEEATNLWEAILAGGNMTYLDDEYVGYVGEDGEINLYGKYENYTTEQLKDTKVYCGRTYEDNDGYPCAYYESN